MNINIIWGVLAPKLNSTSFTFSNIKNILGLSGFDRTILSELQQNHTDSGKPTSSKANLIEAVDKELKNWAYNNKKHFLNILTEEIIKNNPDIEEELQSHLERLGWQFYKKQVIPIEILDISELSEMNESSHRDLIKASIRFRDGDLSGAVTSISSAVESVTNDIYEKFNLGESKNSSFQEKCNKSIKAVDFMDKLETLSDIGWDQAEIKPLQQNLKGSLNQFAYVVQSLRNKMSDAHGTKEVLKPLVFDAIKFAQIIIRILSK